QGSLFLLVVTGFATLAGTGRLDLPSVVAVSAALMARAYLLLTNRTAVIPERWTSLATLAYVLLLYRRSVSGLGQLRERQHPPGPVRYRGKAVLGTARPRPRVPGGPLFPGGAVRLRAHRGQRLSRLLLCIPAARGHDIRQHGNAALSCSSRYCCLDSRPVHIARALAYRRPSGIGHCGRGDSNVLCPAAALYRLPERLCAAQRADQRLQRQRTTGRDRPYQTIQHRRNARGRGE